MKIHMYGTRGSIPVPTDADICTKEFGGNTTCVYMEAADGSKHVLDAGSGIRKLGLRLMKERPDPKASIKANVYFSHLHTDHSLGLPFFVPAYVPGNEITVYGKVGTTGATQMYHKNADKGTRMLLKGGSNGMQNALAHQMHGIKGESFPLDLDKLVAVKTCEFTETGKLLEIGALRVDTTKVRHPRDGCISYKFTETTGESRKTFVYCTDIEIVPADYMKVIEWWKGADVVIADGQYDPSHVSGSLSAYKAGWGHTDWETDITTAHEAGVKTLVLTHHDPMNDDDTLRRTEARAKARAAEIAPGLEVILAREGAVYQV